MLILKFEKIFEKINSLDKFFSGWVQCAPVYSEILTFFSKFQNIYLCGVSKILEVTEVMLILLSKSENGGIGFTHVHCAQTKNILAIEPSS